MLLSEMHDTPQPGKWDRIDVDCGCPALADAAYHACEWDGTVFSAMIYGDYVDLAMRPDGFHEVDCGCYYDECLGATLREALEAYAMYD